MASRRHPEDSVIASIDQVQAMLRDEVAPPPAADLDPHAATQVTHRAGYLASDEPSEVDLLPDLSVPTAAEVEASRAARWAEEAPSAHQLPSRRRKGAVARIGLALGLLGAGAAVGWVAQSRRPAPSALVPLVVAADDAVERTIEARRAAQQSAALITLKAELAEARLKAAGLEAQLADRAAAPPAVSSSAASSSAPPAARRARRRRARKSGLLVTRPGSSRQIRRRPKRRRAKPLSRQDKKLDALIQGL